MVLCNWHFRVSRSLQVGVKGLRPRKLHCMWRVDGRGGELGGYDAVGSDQQSAGSGDGSCFDCAGVVKRLRSSPGVFRHVF